MSWLEDKLEKIYICESNWLNFCLQIKPFAINLISVTFLQFNLVRLGNHNVKFIRQFSISSVAFSFHYSSSSIVCVTLKNFSTSIMLYHHFAALFSAEKKEISFVRFSRIWRCWDSINDFLLLGNVGAGKKRKRF